MRARKLTAQEKFLRNVDEIVNAAQPKPQNDSGYWFLEYERERQRNTELETELAALRAQIEAGQLVDRSQIPQNRTLTITERYW